VNRIASICGFKGMLAEALDQFLKTLDRYTLKDILAPQHMPQLIRLLNIESSPASVFPGVPYFVRHSHQHRRVEKQFDPL
jgi:hypothetical protein